MTENHHRRRSTDSALDVARHDYETALIHSFALVNQIAMDHQMSRMTPRVGERAQEIVDEHVAALARITDALHTNTPAAQPAGAPPTSRTCCDG